MKSFELNYDQIDHIVVNELMEWRSRLIRDYHSGVAVFDTQEDHRKMIDAIATTLSFCMEHESHKLYMKHKPFPFDAASSSVDLKAQLEEVMDENSELHEMLDEAYDMLVEVRSRLPADVCEDCVDIDEVVSSLRPPTAPHIEIVEVVDNPDGSATVTMDMDMDILKKFAGQAILKALIDAAEKVVDDNK